MGINSSTNSSHSAVPSLKSRKTQEPTSLSPRNEQNRNEKDTLGSRNDADGNILNGIALQEWDPQKTTLEPVEMVTDDKENIQSTIEQQRIQQSESLDPVRSESANSEFRTKNMLVKP